MTLKTKPIESGMSDLREKVAKALTTSFYDEYEMANRVMSLIRQHDDVKCRNGVSPEHQHKEDYCNELEWMIKFMDEVEPAIRISVLDECIAVVENTYGNMPFTANEHRIIPVEEVIKEIQNLKTTDS